jgi:nucleotide-binding universal stress UspA family protein
MFFPLANRPGPEGDGLTAAAAHQADLLVLGRSGHSQIWGRFMGTTAERVARHVECSVLIAT